MSTISGADAERKKPAGGWCPPQSRMIGFASSRKPLEAACRREKRMPRLTGHSPIGHQDGGPRLTQNSVLPSGASAGV
jgi:hypothetical protein